MSEHIDVDISAILRGGMMFDQAGDKLIEITVWTCNGCLTATEALIHHEFVLTKLHVRAQGRRR